MSNPIVQLRSIDDHGHSYEALCFVCPGCALDGQTGLHMLPVRGDVPDGRNQWDWDGNEQSPTLNPSILTQSSHRRAKSGDDWVDTGQFVCHSFIRAGQIEFLADCTHALAGQTVPLPPLEDWMVRS